MKTKFLSFMILAILLYSCGGKDKEPSITSTPTTTTVPTTTDNTNTNPSTNPNTNTDTNTNTGTNTEPQTDWKPSYVTNGSIIIYNSSKYFTYGFTVDNKSYSLKPGYNSDVIMLKPGTYTFNITQQNGIPKEGIYKDYATSYQTTAKIVANNNRKFEIPTKYQVIIRNTDKSHRYKLRINGESPISPIVIGKNASITLTLDKGYYYVTAEQLDVALWDTDRATSFVLNSNADFTIKNWQEIEL